MLLLDDGRIVMWVDQVDGTQIRCIVRQGGELSNNKGINRQGGGLSAPALTDKDMEDIKTAASLGIDYVAVSFPASGDDMRLARALLHAAGGQRLLVAKIERAEAVDNLERDPRCLRRHHGGARRSRRGSRRCRRAGAAEDASSAWRANRTSSSSPRRR